MKYIFCLWKDARVKTNEVYGIVELDEFDIGRLIAEKYEQKTGNEVAHFEFRGMLEYPEQFREDLKRLSIGQDKD